MHHTKRLTSFECPMAKIYERADKWKDLEVQIAHGDHTDCVIIDEHSARAENQRSKDLTLNNSFNEEKSSLSTTNKPIENSNQVRSLIGKNAFGDGVDSDKYSLTCVSEFPDNRHFIKSEDEGGFSEIKENFDGDLKTSCQLLNNSTLKLSEIKTSLTITEPQTSIVPSTQSYLTNRGGQDGLLETGSNFEEGSRQSYSSRICGNDEPSDTKASVARENSSLEILRKYDASNSNSGQRQYGTQSNRKGNNDGYLGNCVNPYTGYDQIENMNNNSDCDISTVTGRGDDFGRPNSSKSNMDGQNNFSKNTEHYDSGIHSEWSSPTKEGNEADGFGLNSDHIQKTNVDEGSTLLITAEVHNYHEPQELEVDPIDRLHNTQASSNHIYSLNIKDSNDPTSDIQDNEINQGVGTAETKVGNTSISTDVFRPESEVDSSDKSLLIAENKYDKSQVNSSIQSLKSLSLESQISGSRLSLLKKSKEESHVILPEISNVDRFGRSDSKISIQSKYKGTHGEGQNGPRIKLPLLTSSVVHFMATGKMAQTAEETTRKAKKKKKRMMVQLGGLGETFGKPRIEHPAVQALDDSLDRLDLFIRKNLNEETTLYRKTMMPKHFKKHGPLETKYKTVVQSLKMQELLVCIQERREGSKVEDEATKQDERVSPDGASVPEAVFECSCDPTESSPVGKGKGRGKKSQNKKSAKSEGTESGTMGCCCRKSQEKAEEEPNDLILEESLETEPPEPEVIVETEDVAIQVDVEEVKNNIVVEKPKKPKFVSVYLAAADESAPRYMLAKNIRHKDRTQYTYIENRENNHTSDQSEAKNTETKSKITPRPINQSLDASPRLIQVKESESTHDFSERDSLLGLGYSQDVLTISSAEQSEDGRKWGRGVDTEQLERETEVLEQLKKQEQLDREQKEKHQGSEKDEEQLPQDFTIGSGTADSGIETIDMDTYSEMDIPTHVSEKGLEEETKDPDYASVYGTPQEISEMKHIAKSYEEKKYIVPKNRGTTIDQRWRLMRLRKVYNPFNIDYSMVRINRHGKMVIGSETPGTKSTNSTPWQT